MSTATFDPITSIARSELVQFFRATLSEGIEGSPSKALDQYWHEWLADEQNYRRTCLAEVGVLVGHQPCPPSLARYQAARAAVLRRFGAVDPAWWPETTDVADVADCRDYQEVDDPPRGG